MGRLRRFRAKEVLGAARLNEVLDEVERLGRWTGKPPLSISDGRDGFRAEVALPASQQWFWTTSGVAAATVGTGTTVPTATLTYGSGTARPCVTRLVGGVEVVSPDPAAADVAISNGVTAAIASGRFAKCSLVQGVWVVDLTATCS